MKFRVTGQNRDSGARMVLEFEAESKAAAERKAMQQGMSVNRVEDISDGHVGHAMDPNPAAGRMRRGSNNMMWVVVLVVIVVLAYLYRAQIMARVGIHH